MPSYQDQTWIRLWKENAPELRSRVIGWRKQNAITRIDKPSRLQRARRLGYKAKQGIVVVRMRVGTGGMRKQRNSTIHAVRVRMAANIRVMVELDSGKSKSTFSIAACMVLAVLRFF